MVKKRKPIGNRRPQTGRGAAAGGGNWLYGTHAVRAALANPVRELHRLLIADPEAESPPGLALRPEIVTRAEVAALLPEGAVHQGIALLADALPSPAIEDFCAACADRDRAAAIVLD
ncbi:MAG: RNA methyltransferase substrate-binding domain-containing protein, partial [Rhodospirillales bacterium]